MKVDGIENGIVLDHITAGKGMLVYKYLHLDRLTSQVALIQNCTSGKMGKKDIVKISEDLDLDLDVLGYIDPGITVNYIKNGARVEKKALSLPETLTNVLTCKTRAASARPSRSFRRCSRSSTGTAHSIAARTATPSYGTKS